MRVFKCPICGVEKSRRSLACHAAKAHKLNKTELCKLLFHGGKTPLCKCGCGKERKPAQRWSDENEGFNEFLRGHNGFSADARKKGIERSIEHRRKHGPWNKGLTKATHASVAAIAEKSPKTLKHKYQSGEITPWQKGLTKETSASVKKMSHTIKQQYLAGRRNWNHGLTKSIDSRIVDIAEKIREKMLLPSNEVLRRVAGVDTFNIVDVSQFNGINGYMDFSCNECGHIISRTLKWVMKDPMCPSCSPKSRGQCEIYEFIKQLGYTNLALDAQNVIAPKYVDIWVPDKKFAIEYNGLYWHSQHMLQSRLKASDDSMRYHEMKTQTCAEKHIRLLHVWEDEWRDKRPIIESMIRARLGETTRVFDARRCKIVELTGKEGRDVRRSFFEANHIDGDVRATHAWALYYHDMPVACISLRKPSNMSMKSWGFDSCWEIARFATLCDSRVRGGLGRLVKHAKRQLTLPLVTYVDLRHGDGNSYRSVGFEDRGKTQQPRFWWTDYVERYDRFKYRADKARGMTEAQVADEAGVVRVYGCPNRRLVLV